VNLVEGLAAEISRVTELRGHYEELRNLPNVIVGPQITMMSAAIHQGIRAMGGGDIAEMMVAYQDLKDWEK
jgi:hypothetical protein